MKPSFWKTFLATGFGLGRLPLAPGTWGTLGGILLGWLLQPPLPSAVYLILVLGLGVLVVPVVTAVEKRMERKDPPCIVIDELLAFPLAMFLVPFHPLTVLAAFVLFRIADIAKPWPCRRLQDLPGGWGVMADDYVAAAYCCAALHLAGFLFPSLLS